MNRNHYLEKVIENLGPISQEKANPSAILKEWVATGNSYDNEDASEDCGVCSHPDCRYMFQIVNKETNSQTYSGSTCILRFSEIAYRGIGGVELFGEAKQQAMQAELNKLKVAATKKARLKILAEIQEKLPEIPEKRRPVAGVSVIARAIEGIRDSLESNEKVLLGQLLSFAYAVRETGSAIPLATFQGVLDLRSTDIKRRLVRLAKNKNLRWQYEMIRPAISDAQRLGLEKYYEKMKQADFAKVGGQLKRRKK